LSDQIREDETDEACSTQEGNVKRAQFSLKAWRNRQLGRASTQDMAHCEYGNEPSDSTKGR